MRHTTTAALFQHSLQTTDRWLKEVMTELGWSDLQKAHTALRATLHALREQLPVDECAQLSAQLPLILRGIYWEGWNPHEAKAPPNAFLTAVHSAFKHDPDTDPERIAHAVFKTMATEIAPGEMEDVRQILPRDLRRLMPARVSTGEPIAARQGPRRSLPGSRSPGRRSEPVALQPGDVAAAHWGA